MSVGIYASETWKITTKTAQKLNVFHQDACARSCTSHVGTTVTNEEVRLRTGSRKLADTVAECRFRLAGHILPGFEQSTVISNHSTLDFTLHCDEQRIVLPGDASWNRLCSSSVPPDDDEDTYCFCHLILIQSFPPFNTINSIIHS